MKIKMIIRQIRFWFQRRIKGWSDDETWDLDVNIVKFINSRLKKYYEDAGKILDLTFHKYEYCGNEYTLEDLIKYVIDITNYLLEEEVTVDNYRELNKVKDEMYDVMKLIHNQLGW